MKQHFKKKLDESDIFLILVNIIPVVGVWFYGWNPREVFLVYCLESVLIGLFNVLKLLLTTLVKGRDVWSNQGSVTMMSGFFFIIFFIVHYGFFLFVQVSIFLSIADFSDLPAAPDGFFDFIFHFQKFITGYAYWLLISFVISYAFQMLKNFVFTGAFRTASLGVIMFQPYVRVFVQQFAVILGAVFLMFAAGKIFILIFAVIKTVFEVMLDYDKVVEEGMKANTDSQ